MPLFFNKTYSLYAKITPTVISTAPKMDIREMGSPSSSHPTNTVTNGEAYS